MKKAALGLALLAFLAARRSRPSTVVPMTFEQLVNEAAAVVYARVADVRGQWTADRRSIDSVITLEALQYLKGDLGPTVFMRLPGGRGRRRDQRAAGRAVAAARRSRRAVSQGARTGDADAAGIRQGIFRVARDARSGQMLVTPPPLKESAAGRIVRGAAERRALNLATFAAAVQCGARIAVKTVALHPRRVSRSLATPSPALAYLKLGVRVGADHRRRALESARFRTSSPTRRSRRQLPPSCATRWPARLRRGRACQRRSFRVSFRDSRRAAGRCRTSARSFGFLDRPDLDRVLGRDELRARCHDGGDSRSRRVLQHALRLVGGSRRRGWPTGSRVDCAARDRSPPRARALGAGRDRNDRDRAARHRLRIGDVSDRVVCRRHGRSRAAGRRHRRHRRSLLRSALRLVDEQHRRASHEERQPGRSERTSWPSTSRRGAGGRIHRRHSGRVCDCRAVARAYVVRVEPLDDVEPESFFPGVTDVDFRATYASRVVIAPRGAGVQGVNIEVQRK